MLFILRLLAVCVFTQLAAFQTLVPYHIKQQNDASCSLATATVLLNAILDLPQPITQDAVLAKVNRPDWTFAVADDDSSGVTLDVFSTLLSDASRSFGLTDIYVKTIHLSSVDSSSREKLRTFLKLVGEGKALVVVNFDQALLIPSSNPGGHFSPIGDYDSAGRVLILDTDRAFTNPYWVSEEKLLQSMHTLDQDAQPSQFRGYLVVLKN